MKPLLILLLLFTTSRLHAQESKSLRITSIVSAGFAAGESSAKPIFHWSGGLKAGRMFYGLGAGFDQYYFNSFPVYADCRYDFGKTGAGFLYANGGYSIPGSNPDKFDDPWNSKTTYEFEGGLYMDAGVGYRIRLKDPSHRVLFSAGYSRKTIKNIVGYTYACLVPPCDEQIFNYKYELGRIVAKLSWEFGR